MTGVPVRGLPDVFLMTGKNRLRQIFFYGVLIALPLICIELGMRIFMGIWHDPSVIFFGTGLMRTEIQRQIDPLGYYNRKEYKYKKIKREDVKADVEGKRYNHANYSKYYPGETRVDFNEKSVKFVVKMNNKGFRGPDINDKKKLGTIRIVTLGASSTFGFHDLDSETYPYYLQEILNERLKKVRSDKIKNFEVINLGIPTLRIENIYSLFINEALPLNPDIVTLYTGMNNACSLKDIPDLKKKYPRSKFSKFLTSVYQEIRHRSLLWTFSANMIDTTFTKYNINNLADDKQISKGKSMDLPAFFEVISQNIAKRQEAMTSSFLRHLSMINEECKKHHILFIVANQQATSCTFAHEKNKGRTYQEELLFVINRLKNNEAITLHQLQFLKHALLMKEIRLWAQKEKVMFVDVIKAMDQDRDAILTNVHLNSHGNKIIAQEFMAKIFPYAYNKYN